MKMLIRSITIFFALWGVVLLLARWLEINPFWPAWSPRGPQSGLWVPKGANFGGSKSPKKKVAGLSPRGESLFI